MKRLISLVLLLLVFFSCDENNLVDCSAVFCAGPSILVFEVLQNGQNVFENELFSKDNITITGDFPSTFEFQIEESSDNDGTILLFVKKIDWQTGTYDFQLMVDDFKSQELSTSIVLSTGDCCGGIPQISEYTINGTSLENPNQVVTIHLR